MAAAQLIDLKILQLQNDYTAVALNYGIFQRKEINETAHYYVFYDMGALKTSATVVGYQLVKDKATRETNPVASILGVAYDRNLGGLEMQLRLRDYLADEFNAMKKTKTDVRTNDRAFAKLFKEAGRVKNVLSANTEHFAQIEGLIEEIDFKFLVTREKFEELCADLFERVPGILEKALSNAHLTLDVVRQVIIVGGGTRVPKVQELLKKTINQELGKNLNADEAASMGAVYRAADLATGFKVKKFITKDAVLFPLQVVFERESGESGTKQVKRTLFGPMNPYPQKKVITFNKHTDDFSFDVLYSDLDHLPASEIAALGSLNLTRISLSEVAKALELSKPENIESKGIKAHFALDDSGILSLTGAELVLEKTVNPGEADNEDDSPLSRLGSTISKLFSSGDDDKTKEKEDKPTSEDGVNEEFKEFVEKEEGEKSEEKTEKETEAPKTNTTASNETQVPETGKADNKTEKAKVVVIKESIPSQIHVLYTQVLDGDQYKESRKKLGALEEIEKAKVRRETALNNLESFVIDTQEKLSRKEYSKCATNEELEAILKACSEISDWLYEDGADGDAITYEKKYDQIEKLTNPVFSRHWEHTERPDALKALTKQLEEATKFSNTAANLTKATNPDKDVYTEVEIQTLARLIQETTEWRETEVKEQKLLAHNVEVRLTVKAITDKMAALDREVKYLVTKIKYWKPKVKETPKEDIKIENQEEKPIVEDVDEGKAEEKPIDYFEENVINAQQEEGERIEPTETEQKDEDSEHTEL